MTTRTTLTHWGAIEVTGDGPGIEARGHRADPDPTDIVDPILNNDVGRVTEPLVRRSWLDHGPLARPERRGDEPLVPVDWDVALDLAAEALRVVRRERGSSAIFGGSYGWGSAGRFHHPQSQLKRFLNLGGGYTDSVGTYSHGAAEVVVPAVTGLRFADFQRTAPPGDEVADHTDLFVSFGGFPGHNTKVTSGGEVIHWYRPALRRARNRGCRFVSIGPTIGPFDRELGADWFPIRPGTDTALLLALATEVITSGRAQVDLGHYRSGGQALSSYLGGWTDGTIRNADWAAPICGLDPGRIRALATDLVQGATLLNATWSIQRVENGEQATWATLVLGALIGWPRGGLGRPGAGVALGYGSMGSVGAPVVTARPASLPQGANPVESTIPVARIADALLQPGARYTYAGQAAVYPDIDLVYWCGGNPFHHHQDLNRLARAWRRPRAVLVNEPRRTATAERADIVLPSTFGFERADLGGASTGGHLVAMEAVGRPPVRARHDHDIFRALARRLGYEPAFTEGRSIEQWLNDLHRRTIDAVPDLPDRDTLIAKSIVARPSVGRPAAPTILVGFEPEATPTGATPHPQWLDPTEGAGVAADGELQLVSPMPADRLHSQWGTRPTGPPEARLSPADARRFGLIGGDVVRLHNDRGSLMARLCLDDGVMPGVISIDNGYPFDPSGEDGACRGGNVNVLIADRPSSAWAQATTAHSCLVRLTPVDRDGASI